jgi:ABC-type uncharacterized transport system permease subunit
LQQFLAVLSPLAYLVAVGLYRQDLDADDDPQRRRRRGAWVAVAFGLHSGLIAWQIHAADGVPSLGFFSFLSALAYALVLFYGLLLARGEARGSGIGSVVVSTAFALHTAGMALGDLTPATDPDHSALFLALHVLCVLVAAAALVLSGIFGVLYLALYRRLREHRVGRLFAALPSLSELAGLMRRTALVAAGLLLLATNGGIWWAHAAGVPNFTYGAPFVWVILSLTVYFALIGFSGRIPWITARRASVAASLGLVLLAIGLGFSFDSFHSWDLN